MAVSTQFRVQEQLTLIRITQAMRQYKARYEEYPQEEEVFWEKIIKENSISLPDLPKDQKFLYDPELADETDGEQSLRILQPR